ncbi:MAG TPA: hypothetical protein VGJ71_02965, partial [Candidatus Limnocylindrales bacterium]
MRVLALVRMGVLRGVCVRVRVLGSVRFQMGMRVLVLVPALVLALVLARVRVLVGVVVIVFGG